MTGARATTRQEAIDWAIRAQDAAFDDWEALADWLAADPYHAILYDQVTIGADEAARAPQQDAPSASASSARAAEPPTVRRPRRWLPFALAACLVATVGGGLALYQGRSAPAFYTVSTAAGGRQSVDLAGAVRMELNGDTRITLDRNDPRFARLDQGEAMFTVVHDPKRPFELHVGTMRVTDIGTVFDVEQYDAGMRVAVAHGAVRVTTGGGSVAVAAGSAVTVGEDGVAVMRHDQDAHSVGAWRDGQIDFADISLAQLASRLHRASGARISVAPEIANRRVSGSIVFDGDRDAVLRGLGPVLGVSVGRGDEGWVWSGRVGAKPS